jgi:hypothetical protein
MPYLTLMLLAIAYPDFRFNYERFRWIALRKDPCASGVHTIVTDDFDELIVTLGVPDFWQWSNLRRLTGKAGARDPV